MAERVWRKTITTHRKGGKRVPAGTPGATKRRTKTPRFYGTLRTADGKRKQVALTDDRETSRTLLRTLQHDEDHAKAHGIDRTQRERSRPLSELVAEYESVLRSRANTDRYVVSTIQRINELVSSIKAKTIADVDAAAIARTLSVWRQTGRPDRRRGRKRSTLSVASSNHYARAIKAFSRWLWTEKRTSDDVLSNLRLLNGNSDRRRVRRSLTPDELATLVETTESSRKTLAGLRSTDRAMLYLVAAFTGLRASELASLTVRSFDFGDAARDRAVAARDGAATEDASDDDASGTVVVEAAYSKRRRRDVLPLHPFLVSRLRPWLSAKTGTLWAGSWAMRRRGAITLRRDLKRAGIAYADESGRVVDFHALRHTFVSSLARAGVHPAKAKELARHSTITLTMDVYAHVETDELRSALGSVPGLPTRRDDG
jgi:integrase